MQFLNTLMSKSLLVLFVIAAIFMALQPFTDVGFVEPISVLLLTVFLYILLRKIYSKLKNMTEKGLKITIFVLFVLFIIFQIIAVTQVHIMSFGDPWHMIAQATRLSQGQQTWDVWIRQYPNLVPMVGLYVLFIKIANFLHLSFWAILYSFNIIINCLIWLSLTKFFWNKSKVTATFVIFFATVLPMSYDFLLRVGYSDGIAILALILLAVKFDQMKNTKKLTTVNFISIIILFLLGYLARPNVIVFVIALLIFGILAFTQRQKDEKLWKNIGKFILACIFGIVLATGANRGIAGSLHYDLKNPDVFPTTNWIYEGLNFQSMGEWTPTDRYYTLYHHGYETAKEADMAGIKERLGEFAHQPWKLPVLWLVKFAQLWSCGTFATGTDYELFAGTYNFTHGPSWYVQNIAAINIFMQTYAKALMTLILSMIALAIYRQKSVKVNVFGLAILTTMGISLFHILLWEVKPRYQLVTFGLLMIAAGLQFDEFFTEKSLVKFDRKAWKITFPILSILSLILMLSVMRMQAGQKIVVNAQQHQLNHFGYDNGVFAIQPYEKLTQNFTLPIVADHVELTTNSSQNLQLSIERNIGNHWENVKNQTILAHQELTEIQQKLPAGTYRFVVKNQQNQAVKMEIMTNTANLDYPNLIQLGNHKTASFGFIISQDKLQNRYPAGLIITFAVIFVIENVLILRKKHD